MTFTATQQDLIDDFTTRTSAADTVDAAVDIGVDLFSTIAFEGASKTCWPIFRKKMDAIAPEDSGKTVIAVDFPAIFYTVSSKYGLECGLDVVNRINDLVEKVGGASTVILAHDSPKSIRRDRFAGYKATRPAKPDGFFEARADVVGYVQSVHNMRLEEVEGWESDDLMASIAFRCKLRKQKCIIITDDKDLMQCCGNGVTCYSHRTNNYSSEVSLQATHGLNPKQVVDWLAMGGKDDVPSIAGVGLPTAEKWLQKHTDFMGVFCARHELTEKKRQAVEEFALSGQYFLAYDLHTLNKRLKVNW